MNITKAYRTSVNSAQVFNGMVELELKKVVA